MTYCKQVARILNRRCVSCHRKGEIAPFRMTNYEEVSGWADAIAEAVHDRRMPPWLADPDSADSPTIAAFRTEEKQILVPMGGSRRTRRATDTNCRHLPKFIDGWQLPKKPDKVFYITLETVRSARQGPIRYQYFHLDPGFTEDKWIRASKFVQTIGPSCTT